MTDDHFIRSPLRGLFDERLRVDGGDPREEFVLKELCVQPYGKEGRRSALFRFSNPVFIGLACLINKHFDIFKRSIKDGIGLQGICFLTNWPISLMAFLPSGRTFAQSWKSWTIPGQTLRSACVPESFAFLTAV